MSLFSQTIDKPNTENPSPQRSLELLKSIFGYTTFRSEQATIIQHVVSKQDSVVIMPTGGGKSLCYQIPALQLEGT